MKLQEQAHLAGKSDNTNPKSKGTELRGNRVYSASPVLLGPCGWHWRKRTLRRDGDRCSSSRHSRMLLPLVIKDLRILSRVLLQLMDIGKPGSPRIVDLRGVAVGRGDVKWRSGRARAWLLVLELLPGREEGRHLLLKEVGHGGRGRGGGRRGGGSEGRVPMSSGPSAGAGGSLKRVLPRGGLWDMGRAEERDEDVADQLRLGGEVDAELRLELPHHSVRRNRGAAAAGRLADEGLHVVGQLLVGHHRAGRGWVLLSSLVVVVGGGGGGGASRPF